VVRLRLTRQPVSAGQVEASGPVKHPPAS
jgi:hypothetical protein